MPIGSIATMDTLGFINEPSIKLDRAFAYWLANRKSQSSLFDNVESFMFVVAEHQDDKRTTDLFVEAVNRSLTNHLSGFFNDVSVSCRTITESEESKCFTLVISARVIENGAAYDLEESLLVNGETYKRILKSRGL